MKIDMSPEGITNRLKTMEQLWELSVNLMNAREIPKTVPTLESEHNSIEEKNGWKDAENLNYID